MQTPDPMWRKSSHSTDTSNCVDVAWRKSSRSSNASNCVEVALSPTPAVRDSKNPSGPTLAFPVSAWSTFLRR
jgi:hypothetical protein